MSKYQKVSSSLVAGLS